MYLGEREGGGRKGERGWEKGGKEGVRGVGRGSEGQCTKIMFIATT